MGYYIARRLAQTAVTALIVSLLVFTLVRLSGDPVRLIMPSPASQEDLAFFRTQLGLDKPLPQQFLTFLGNALSGDFGKSFRYDEPALDLVLSRVPATVELAVASMILAVLIGVPIGIVAALRRGHLVDLLVRWFAMLGQSTPSFWLGMLLILVFAVHLQVVPSSGRGSVSHLILPAVALGWFSAASIARLVRSSMLEAMQSDFVKLERLVGLPERVIVMKHALRNAAVPIVTYMALQFGVLLSGAVVTEKVFAWPGIGQLTVNAIMFRDFPVIQAAVLVIAAFFLVINFAVDVLYRVLDPRIRL